MIEELVQQYYENKRKEIELQNKNKEIKELIVKELGNPFNDKVDNYNVKIGHTTVFYPTHLKADMPEIYNQYSQTVDSLTIKIWKDKNPEVIT